jgi:glycosyltransferase involved in cell wall biosynthesis
VRILWVTPQHPDPVAGGGGAHEYELLRRVADRHDIHVVTSAGYLYDGRSSLPELGISYDVVPSPTYPYPKNKLEVAWAMVRARPTLMLWTMRRRWDDLSAAVTQQWDSFRPDLLHVSLGELAPVLAAARGPSSLLLFDSYTRHVERRLTIERLPRRRLQLQVERRRAAAWERRWYSKASAVASVSSVDAARFRELLHRPVDVIENPIADDYFAPPTEERSRDTVLFVGSLAYPPNTDAITWIVDEIWPAIRARRPDAKLVIAGRGDDDAVTVPRVRGQVEAAGGVFAVDVPDIRPYYWQAAVVLAPIRLGAGLRNKVIHAMACQAPVIATPAALEGIAVADSEVIVSDTAAGIADAAVRVLNDPATVAPLVARAAAAMQRHRSDVIGETFDRWLRSAAGTLPSP